MPKTVLLPNAQVMSFPDDATTVEMNLSIGSYFPELFTAQTPTQPTEQLADIEGMSDPEPVQPGVGKVFGRSWDQMEQLLGYATEATGEALGSETIKNYGKKVIRANQKELEEWDIVMPPLLKFSEIEGFGLTGSNERGAWDYFQQGIANVLPYIIAGAPVAAVGAVTAPAWVPTIGTAGATGVAGILGRMTASTLGKRAIGAGTFRFLPSAIFGTGEAQQEIKELDPNVEDPWTAFKYGAAIGALDAVSLAPLMIGAFGRYGVKPVYKAIQKGAGEKAAKSAMETTFNAINKVAVTRLGKGALLGLSQATSEGFTERLQEILAMEAGFDATGKRISVADRAERLLEATAQGAFVGGGIGITTGAITGGTPKPLVANEALIKKRVEGLEKNYKEVGEADIQNEGDIIIDENIVPSIKNDLTDPSVVQRMGRRITKLFGRSTYRDEKVTIEMIQKTFGNATKEDAQLIIDRMIKDGILNEELGIGPAIRQQVDGASQINTAKILKEIFGEDIVVDEEQTFEPPSTEEEIVTPFREAYNKAKAEEAIVNEDAVLPKDLRKSRAYYKYRKRPIDLTFKNDLAKALFFMGTKEKSARYDDFYAFLENNGVKNIEQSAIDLRDKIRQEAKDNDQVFVELSPESLTVAEEVVTPVVVATKKVAPKKAAPKKYTPAQIRKLEESLDYQEIKDSETQVAKGVYKGRPFEIREELRKGVTLEEGSKPYIMTVSIDGVLIPELRSEPYALNDREYGVQLNNLLPKIMSVIDYVAPVKKDVKSVEEDDVEYKDFKKITVPNTTAELPNRITIAGVPAAQRDNSKKDNGIEIEVDGVTYRLIREKRYSNSRKVDGSPTTRFGKVIRGTADYYLYVQGIGKVMREDKPDTAQGFGSSSTDNGISHINRMIKEKRKASVAPKKVAPVVVAPKKVAPVVVAPKVKKQSKPKIDPMQQRLNNLQGKDKYTPAPVKEGITAEESLRRTIFNGSILSKENQKKLLEAFGGDQNMLDSFKREIRQLQDMIRTFAPYEADGSINKSAANRMAHNVANFDLDTPSGLSGGMFRVNAYENIMASMNFLARKFPAFAKMHLLLSEYNTYQRTILSEFNEYYRELAALDTPDKTNTLRFITVANILGDKGNFTVDEVNGTASVTIPENYKVTYGNGRVFTGQKAIDYELGNINNDTSALFANNPVVVGEPITLDNVKQVKAFMSLKRGLEASFETRIIALVRYMDEGDGVLNGLVDTYEANVKTWKKNDAVGTKPSLSVDLTNYAQSLNEVADPEAFKFYGDLAIYVTELEATALQNYFPNVRQGDGIFRIIDKAEKDVKATEQIIDPISGEVLFEVGEVWIKKGQEKTVYRTDVIIPFYVRSTNRSDYIRKWAVKNLPQQLQETFPISTDETKGFQWDFTTNSQLDQEVTNDRGRGGNLSIDIQSSQILTADKTARQARGLTAEENREAFKNDLLAAVEQIKINRQKSGLSNHYSQRAGVPGYMTPLNSTNYHDNAYSIYQSKVARYVARILTEKRINQEMDILKAQGEPTEGNFAFGSNIYTVARKARAFTFAPQSSMNMFKAVAFYGFLGGNISSILINMMQSAVSAVVLTSAFGIAGTLAMTKAFAQGSIIALNSGLSKRGLYIPKLDSGEAFSKENAEKLYAKLKRLRLVRDRDEYNMLGELTYRGIIGKVNTEALSQNSDLTSQYYIDKLGINQDNRLVRAGLKTSLKFGEMLAKLYAYGEITNRISTALATYRLVKQRGVENLNTLNSAEVARSDLTNTEEGYIDAAEGVVTMTQFSLDAYNRPLIARQAGGVPIQFLPFVQMMIELYANGIMGRFGGTPQISTEQWTRQEVLDLINEGKNPEAMGIFEGNFKEQGRTSVAAGTIDSVLGVPIPSITNKQAATMIVGLVTMQMMLAGAYGMPYADDLNEIIKLLSKGLGLPEIDVKQEMRNTMIENGIAEGAVDAFSEGVLSSMTGLSVHHRFSLNMISNYMRNMDNPALLVGGPAASFMDGYMERINKYIRRGMNGDTMSFAKAGLALVPAGLTTNILKGMDVYADGETTKSGNILMEPFNTRASLLKTIGFTTNEVNKARKDMAAAMYLVRKRKELNKKITQDVARLYYKGLLAYRDKRDVDHQEIFEKIRQLRIWVMEHDAKGDEEGIWKVENMIDPNGTLFSNAYERAQTYMKVGEGASAAAYTRPRGKFKERVKEVTGQPTFKEITGQQ